MRCEYHTRKQGQCKSEAVGRASDAYGGSDLCAIHLKPLGNDPHVTITWFDILHSNQFHGEKQK